MTTQRDHRPVGEAGVRIPRDSELAPVGFEAQRRTVSTRGLTSPMLLIYGFAIADAIGTALLMLPFASTTPGSVDPLTAVFTATSCITVTGLLTVDTGTAWTGFGQAVILFMIFFGGLGFMTGTAFLLILFGQELGLRNRLIIQTGLGGGALAGIRVTVRNIFILSAAIQIIGFVVLWVHWNVISNTWADLDFVGQTWQTLFHAISSFNNAGIEIMPDDLVGGESMFGFRRDLSTLGLTIVLCILGGLGYTVIADIWTKRRFRRFTLETKIVLLGTVLLLAFAFITYMFEWDNPDLYQMEPVETASADAPADPDAEPEFRDAGFGVRVSDAVFHSVTTRSAGFAVIDYGNVQGSTEITTELLMFIGAASGSTGGGTKVNTFIIIIATVIVTMTGRSSVNLFGRRLPDSVVTRALAVGLSAITIVMVLVFALAVAEDGLAFDENLFEIVSAFSTTGLSKGVTSELGPAGQVIIIIAMFIGRLGPLTLGLLMAGAQVHERYTLPQEGVRIG